MNEIERICREIAAEANAIAEYTQDIESGVVGPESVRVFNDIRADELEHLEAHLVLLKMCLKEGEANEQG